MTEKICHRFRFFANAMSLFITSLNSGSNGNCYYVGNDDEAVLVDAGISCRETDKRMARLGLSMLKVKALFVSHEHSDHIRGVEVLAKKYQLPVYITQRTLVSGKLRIDPMLVRSFEAHEEITIGGLTIVPFKKYHDAADPYSFTISGNGVNIGVFTDIGAPCEHLINNFKKCHAAFLEANYDAKMLDEGNYPYYLKKRISGGHGHLSNHQALHIFKTHRSPELSLLLLSHLSKNNNSPELAHEMFMQHAGDTQIVVASRYEETSVYEVSVGPASERVVSAIRSEQMSLF
ncbi:MAG: beta-lactamase domain protein [Bacteroidota bacterium]|nr:beta-lactamase domain protein [Bacteroidota bacterium]